MKGIRKKFRNEVSRNVASIRDISLKFWRRVIADSTIADKDKRISDLRKKNQELEKFKFVLDYKIRELNRQIQPREIEIEKKKKQLEEMNAEVRKYKTEYAVLQLNVKELNLKLNGMNDELERQSARNQQLQKRIER